MTPMVDTTGKRLKNGEVLSFYKVKPALFKSNKFSISPLAKAVP